MQIPDTLKKITICVISVIRVPPHHQTVGGTRITLITQISAVKCASYEVSYERPSAKIFITLWLSVPSLCNSVLLITQRRHREPQSYTEI